MKFYINDISMSLPSQKSRVTDSLYLTPEKKQFLNKMGYDEYYLGSPEDDAMELAVRASKDVLSRTPQITPDFLLYHQLGMGRSYGDWPSAAYLQNRLGLQKTVGISFSSMCTSFTTAVKMLQGFSATGSEPRSALIPISTSVFSPFYLSPLEEACAMECDAEKRRGLVMGALATSALVSTLPGPVELVEVSDTISFVEGDSWNFPSQFSDFKMNGDKVTGGGHVKISFARSEPQQKTKDYIPPSQIVLTNILGMIQKATARHGIQEMEVSCLPIGELAIDEIVTQATSIKVTGNKTIYKKYGHSGACDPMVAICEALSQKRSGYFCHICIGQGYTASFVIFKI